LTISAPEGDTLPQKEVVPVYEGFIRDIRPHLGTPIRYELAVGEHVIDLNGLLGRQVRVEHTGKKACGHCGRPVSKLFNSGYCWPCFQTLAENDLCVVKPHLCHYETCRDQAWGDSHCMIPTYLYLAKSSDIKVGLTRNIPGRWMDQGAVEAVAIALLPTRMMAGELEYLLSQHMPDKTNWRKMLKGEVTEASLEEVRAQVLALIPEQYRAYILPPQEKATFAYPVAEVPEKVASHDLDKGAAQGMLMGIKAKYLILSTGVLNVTKYTGYYVRFTAEDAGARTA
jgi:hypothetical protein